MVGYRPGWGSVLPPQRDHYPSRRQATGRDEKVRVVPSKMTDEQGEWGRLVVCL